MHLGEYMRPKLHVPDVVALNPKPQIRTANRKGVSLVRFNSFWIRRRRRRQSPEITVTFAFGDSLFMRRSSKLIIESIICSQASTSSLRGQLMKQVTHLCQEISESNNNIGDNAFYEMDESNATSNDDIQDDMVSRSEAIDLIHHREESRHYEFFSGYSESGTGSSKNNKKGYPNYFEHLSPFPDS
ncbi:hypothetical protein ACLB2K_006396 [Fragaria x ananassa]